MKKSSHIVDLRSQKRSEPIATSADVSHWQLTKAEKRKHHAAGRRERAASTKAADLKRVGGLLYKAVMRFGWFLIMLIKLPLLVLRSLKFILLSPIKLLDSLLDLLRAAVINLPRYIGRGLVYLFSQASHALKTYRAKPTLLWGRALVIFVGLSLLLTIPIKLFQPAKSLVTRPAQVLGASTDALRLLGLATSLREYTPVALVAAELTGLNKPTRLMLVFQNNRELRATGGFMGSYALVDIEGGVIQSVDVPTGGFYDLKGSQTRFFATPRPFKVFAPYLQIWNLNWWSDFPTTARKLIEFYEQHGGPSVDGVVALTPNLVEDLLRITGPIELPEYEQVIDADNFVRATQIEVELEYDREANTPKAFIGDLTPLLLDKLIAAGEGGQLQEILAALDSAFEERHLLVYLIDKKRQAVVEELGWAGEVRELPGDYLQVVHNNTGGGKTDIVIKDFLSDSIELNRTGSAIHHVRLTRSHTGRTDDLFEGHDNLDYMRFYTPPGSRLITAAGFTEEPADRFEIVDRVVEQDPDLAKSEASWITDIDSGTHIFDESGKTVFGNWLGLKPGQTKTVSLTYEVPLSLLDKEGDGGRSYLMYYQKQSGSQGTQLDASIDMAPGYSVASVAPQTPHVTQAADNLIKYSNDLRVDRWLKVDFE